MVNNGSNIQAIFTIALKNTCKRFVNYFTICKTELNHSLSIA